MSRNHTVPNPREVIEMEYNVIIVGGGPAGVITALTARSVYPDRSVCLIKEIGDGVIPCAIPYMIHTIPEPEQNRMGNTPLDAAGIDIVVDRVVSLDPQQSTIELESGKVLTYERLVLATGATPSLPPIPGSEKQGVYIIEKSLSSTTTLRDKAREAKDVVILGGGFIGAEFADEIAKHSDANVHIVEMLPKILFGAVDDEFCDEAADILTGSGVTIHTGIRAVSIDGSESVESVTLENGEKIPAEMVIIGVGGKPNTEMAKQAGLLVTGSGSIWVDSYMRTSAEHIFAVGDCALKRDFFTRRELLRRPGLLVRISMVSVCSVRYRAPSLPFPRRSAMCHSPAPA